MSQPNENKQNKNRKRTTTTKKDSIENIFPDDLRLYQVNS